MKSISIFIIYILTAFGTYVVNFWVGAWMEDKYGLSKLAYNIIYLILGLATCLMAVLQAVLLGAVSKSAALNIYQSINWNMLRRPMRFFDTTPSGVILNRCITDVAIIDFEIPRELGMFLATFITTIVILIMTSILSPVVIVAVVGCFVYVALIFKKFVSIGTELKRLV